MTQRHTFSEWFIDRPVATTLISIAFIIIGLCCYPLLPVAPLPQTDIPTIRVTADFPGASAETMASAIAVPLENAFSGISGINNMISSSSAGKTTVSLQFNLDQNVDAAAQEVQGAAKEFTTAFANEKFLILLALLAIYIILGILYESFSLPLIIISTLPASIIGALLFLSVWKLNFSVVALIGCIMLMGIVLKNGILIVDTALKLEHEEKSEPTTAIYLAAISRFRPILMTSLATALAGIPLIIGQGTGAELRQPLGVVITGGLCISQILTVFTTPVIYLYIKRLLERFISEK